MGLLDHSLAQTAQIRIYKAELHHLTKQKEKVDEVSGENLQECLYVCMHV